MGNYRLNKRQKEKLDRIVTSNYNYFLTVPKLKLFENEEIVQKSLLFITKKMSNGVSGLYNLTDEHIKNYIVRAIKDRTRNYLKEKREHKYKFFSEFL